MSDWRERLRWSADLFLRYWPDVREACGCIGDADDLIYRESPERGNLQMLDILTGIDYIARTPRGGTRSISARVQQYPHLYRSTTIRRSLRSGRPTEWMRSVSAFKYEDALPDLRVQIYVDRREDLVGYGVTKNRQLLEWLVHGPQQEGYTFTVQKVDGGNTMMVTWWEWMRRDGLHVETHGESRLRAAPVARLPMDMASEMSCAYCGELGADTHYWGSHRLLHSRCCADAARDGRCVHCFEPGATSTDWWVAFGRTHDDCLRAAREES